MKNLINVLLYLALGAIISLPFIVFNFNYSLESKELFLGGLSTEVYKWSFVFAFFGMFLRWRYKTHKGIRTTERSPHTFKLDYWIRDNFVNKSYAILATYVAVFILLRFSQELLGYELKMIIAFFIGLFLDFLIDKLMNLNPDVIFSKRKKSKIN